MNKTIKILSIILLIAVTLMLCASVTFAAVDGAAVITDLTGGTVDSSANTSVTNMGKQIVAVVQTVGIVIAVVVILVLGIKYMLGSPEEKSEYKKTMVPYLVGAVLIFAATTIVNIIYNLANSLNTGK